LVGVGTKQNKSFTEVMHDGAGEYRAQGAEHFFTHVSFLTPRAHLNEGVRGQCAVDFLEHRVGQTFVTDQYNGTQSMRIRPQGTALARAEF
jgi:hypothetical protein